MPTRKVNNSVEGFGIAFIEAASYGSVLLLVEKMGVLLMLYLTIKLDLICDGNDLKFNLSILVMNIFYKMKNLCKLEKEAQEFF